MGQGESRVALVSINGGASLHYTSKGGTANVAQPKLEDADFAWKVEAYSMEGGRPHTVSIRSDHHPQCPLGGSLQLRDPGIGGMDGKSNFKLDEKWICGYVKELVITDKDTGKKESINNKFITFKNSETGKYLAVDDANKELITDLTPTAFMMIITKNAPSPGQVAALCGAVAAAAVFTGGAALGYTGALAGGTAVAVSSAGFGAMMELSKLAQDTSSDTWSAGLDDNACIIRSVVGSRMKEEEEETTPPFRVVRLNGVLIRGDDVGGAVREIVSRLSDIAFSSSSSHQKKDEFNLRFRATSGFASNLSLLDETLKITAVDNIPILLVLDELDAFLGNASSTSSGVALGGGGRNASFLGGGQQPQQQVDVADKQLLMYHLLDRVADASTLLSVVGITSSLTTVSMFEKRVKSRAEGTSKVIYFGHCENFEGVVKILESKFEDALIAAADDNNDEENNRHHEIISSLKEDLTNILLIPTAASDTDCRKFDQTHRIKELFQRSYEQGRDIRWFCRVLALSLQLLTTDYQNRRSSAKKNVNLRLKPRHLLEGLMLMGCADVTFIMNEFDSIIGGGGQNDDEEEVIPDSDDEEDDDDDIYHHANGEQNIHYGPLNPNSTTFPPEMTCAWNDPRYRAVLDLSGPQVAILLSARRITLRDAQKESSEMAPLTYERIAREYEISFISQNRSSGPDRYNANILKRAFCSLVECDVIRPEVDHTGKGSRQYFYAHVYELMNDGVLGKLPLHVTLDLEREVGEALKRKLLDCSLALRDWGMKMN